LRSGVESRPDAHSPVLYNFCYRAILGCRGPKSISGDMIALGSDVSLLQIDPGVIR
jgi:hypothetical protein